MNPYLLITLATVMFSVQFAFIKKFQTLAGAGLKASFIYNVVSPIAYAVIMLALENFKLQFTPFVIITSLIWAVISNAITYFSIKSLSYCSISNYSLFLLSGGMILPVIYGFFTGDEFGIFRVLGILLISFSILIKLNAEKPTKEAVFCYFAIFILNGLISILSSVYQGDLFAFAKPSATQFSIIRAGATSILGLACLVFIIPLERKTQRRPLKNYLKASSWALSGGAINGVANLFLLFALVSLDPSLQYPIVTGGNIFCSALIGLAFKEIPDKKTWISVAVAVLGTVLMVLQLILLVF